MLDFFNKYIFGVAVPILLFSVGIYYTVILKAFHITKPRALLKILFSKRTNNGVSPFRALTLALAGTLGVGNIVGVSAAICAGGFGSIFWMWVSALCAMILKYAEVVLAMRHRRYDKDGTPHGAAMYYIKDIFSSFSLRKLGVGIAGVFAVLCVINAVTMGGMIQSNAVGDAFFGVFGIDPVLCGAVISILCVIVISRGTLYIARLTEILVPLMSAGYVVLSVTVLIIRRDMLPDAISTIISDAFSTDSAAGGILGFLLSRSIRFGTMRGLISNEAGCGTAPIAHCSSSCEEAVEQGIWGIVEVFVDTIVLCTMTALVVAVNFGEINTRTSWLMLTFDAYSNTLGPLASLFLAVAVLCFGFATILCWGHYGSESVNYFSTKPKARNLFIAVYCASVFVGAFSSPEFVWSIADFAIGGMTLINVMALTMAKKEIKYETDIYFGNIKTKRKE